MSTSFNAFEHSPVPPPGPEVTPLPIFRGIYGMPMFITFRTTDLVGSTRFWTEGLGFVELFTVPGRVVHLRRWAFQDVLLVPGRTHGLSDVGSTSFACVRSQIEGIRSACGH